MYTVSYMANKLGISSMELNEKLAEMGLQKRVPLVDDGPIKRTKWVPTADGFELSQVRKGNKGLNAYEILVWKSSLLDQLGFIKPPTRPEFDALVAAHADLKETVNKIKELLNL